MERLKLVFDWVCDPANRTGIVLTLVGLLAASSTLWGSWLIWRKARGHNTANLIDKMGKQNQSLQATIGKLVDQIADIEVTTHAWRRLDEPVRLIAASATDLMRRATITSDLARALLEKGDTSTANGLFAALLQLRRESAVLLAQSQSLVRLLEKRLNSLHRSDAEMGQLVRELMQTKPYLRLPPPQ